MRFGRRLPLAVILLALMLAPVAGGSAVPPLPPTATATATATRPATRPATPRAIATPPATPPTWPSWAVKGVTAAATGSPGSHTIGPIAVGVPDLDLPGAKRAGGVDVYFHNGKTQRVTEQKLGLVGAGKPGAHRFGASVIIQELNGDKYPDLVVGAPGSVVKGAEGKRTEGKVVLLFGSAKGITAKGAQVLSPGEAGDEFGASMVLNEQVLYVGAPGHDQGGIANAG